MHLLRFSTFLLAALPLAAGAQVTPPEVDTMARRVAACTTCHGREGRATSVGYFPRIAGKPAGYLHNQLINFREGRRQYAAMTYLVDHLSDAYLLEIASYFAALDVPYAPPVPAAAPPAVIEQGRALAMNGDAARKLPACAQCHGASLLGVSPAIPGLLGLPRDYLVAQIGAWQNDKRRAHAPDCMRSVAMLLTPAEISAVSSWLASVPVPAGAKPEAGLPAPLPVPCGGVGP